MIKSVNLGKRTSKIFNKVNRLRRYGWFSKDVQEMLIRKYGEEKKLLFTELNDKQKQRDRLEEDIKKIAKRINKCRE
jgi:hypothetical protein|tara:strand:- start:3264 stop:3494 length:231 start_codon:yes stop_codon:yes gene_type:complete